MPKSIAVFHYNPNPSSFTNALTEIVSKAATEAGNVVSTIHLAQSHLDLEVMVDTFANADHIVLIYPLWCELPPASMVNLLQSVLTLNRAYEYVDGVRKVKWNKTLTCIISMGQMKDHNTENLHSAFEYCGINPTFILLQGVGPRMNESLKQTYFKLVEDHGRNM